MQRYREAVLRLNGWLRHPFWPGGLCEGDQESVLYSLRMRPVNGFEIARR
jgi:hypothetical protein